MQLGSSSTSLQSKTDTLICIQTRLAIGAGASWFTAKYDLLDYIQVSLVELRRTSVCTINKKNETPIPYTLPRADDIINMYHRLYKIKSIHSYIIPLSGRTQSIMSIQNTTLLSMPDSPLLRDISAKCIPNRAL